MDRIQPQHDVASTTQHHEPAQGRLLQEHQATNGNVREQAHARLQRNTIQRKKMFQTRGSPPQACGADGHHGC